jgi:hypothetical protein
MLQEFFSKRQSKVTKGMCKNYDDGVLIADVCKEAEEKGDNFRWRQERGLAGYLNYCT